MAGFSYTIPIAITACIFFLSSPSPASSRQEESNSEPPSLPVSCFLPLCNPTLLHVSWNHLLQQQMIQPHATFGTGWGCQKIWFIPNHLKRKLLHGKIALWLFPQNENNAFQKLKWKSCTCPCCLMYTLNQSGIINYLIRRKKKCCWALFKNLFICFKKMLKSCHSRNVSV